VHTARRLKIASEDRTVTTDDVQPLNYSAHALEDLLRLRRQLRGTMPKSAAALDVVIDMLRRSVKFILPNCCELIDPAELRQAHLDLLRPPFACVAFEASWVMENDSVEYLGGQRQTPVTKRIALCWDVLPDIELVPGINRFLQQGPNGGVCVLPIYWGPEFAQWTVAVGGVFVPYGSELTRLMPENLNPPSRIGREVLVGAGQVTDRAKGLEADTFILLPELFERALPNYASRDDLLAHIALDSHDEVMMVIQACSVLNCSNVTTAELAPSASLNKKRRVNGKVPFFTYKVLQLTDERMARGPAGGGHHASPRMHLRRGHVRRLEQKTVWVRPAMVNPTSKSGRVVKDYAIQRPE
jgi:hypothetical protein